MSLKGIYYTMSWAEILKSRRILFTAPLKQKFLTGRIWL